MKTVCISLTILICSFYANCQIAENPKFLFPGYNLNDTIDLEEFLNVDRLSIDDNDFTISSFVLTYSDGEYDTATKNNSGKITDNMKKILLKLKNGNEKSSESLLKKSR